MLDWVNRPALRRAGDSGSALTWGLLGAAAALGAGSLLLYRQNGYSRSMLVLWLAALVALAAIFWSWNRALPRIARNDLLVAVGLVGVFAPLYLAALYRWPVQVSSDEEQIVTAARNAAHGQGLDPLGLSTYLNRPALLLIGWGKLGELLGGYDLFHMRLLHALGGLLTLAAAYALFRQLLPRWWAVFASCVLGVSHSFLIISRLAMRENTAVLAELVALALLFWGLRRNHPLATFLGGVAAGLGFYVYYPARATMAIWIVFLVALGAIGRQRFPVRRILASGAIAIAGFVLVATPIVIAESHIPRPGVPSDYDPQHSTYLIYHEAREREQQWVGASSIADGVKTNIRWGLGAFNNRVTDNGNIYVNPGHGFVDPLTGILLWLGIGLVVFRLARRELDDGELLAAVGFVSLWLASAFLVNKAPNYTRLLVTLPFAAYLVTVAVRWLAGRWRSLRPGAVLVTGGFLAALVVWNLAIAWDYVDLGRRSGDPIGSTGRYVAAHDHIPGQKFFMATTENGDFDYYYYLAASAGVSRMQLFAEDDTKVRGVVEPDQLPSFTESPPFAIFVRRDAWERFAAPLAERYPRGRIRNVTPRGDLVVFEVP
jgi:dolichyl-phosphate-mannose-protein mannosyltransferase